MKYPRHRVSYFDLNIMPCFVGFCPSERAWNTEMRRLGGKTCDNKAYPTTSGACNRLYDQAGVMHVLITLGDWCDKKVEKAEVVGLIVHEVAHAWRWIRECIGEDQPSQEFEAYVMQYLTQTCCSVYNDTRRRIFA